MLRGSALAVATAVLLGAFGALAAPAAAASADERQTASTVATGHDVSYPQCGRSLEQRGDIAVVGVNAGTGTTTNPCLGEQLAWGDAIAADGTPRRADVYVNTANPGHLGDWWPTADLTREAVPITNPFGTCIGAEDRACAYVYGYSIAFDDLRHRGVTDAASRTWWLDVETMNTWSWNRPANLAAIEGMATAVQRAGAKVGIYSTGRQWALIAGSASRFGALAGAPSWIAGAVTRAGALENCATAPFVPGGGVRMAQWVEQGLDHDIACAPGVRGTRPAISGGAVVGGLLSADIGAWGPADTALGVQWFRDGTPIAGATSSSYVATADDEGARLTVRVTGRRDGAPALTLESDARVVQGVPSAGSGAAGASRGPLLGV